MDDMTESERDGVTGLWNGAYGGRVLRELLLRASRSEEQPVTLTAVDIDSLVSINRSHSYEIGDELLREFAKVLEPTLGADETLCRTGGDEFLIISSSKSPGDAKRRAERIRRAAKNLTRSAMTVTVGLAFWPKDGVSPESLTAAADRAVRHGKSLGGDCVVPL